MNITTVLDSSKKLIISGPYKLSHINLIISEPPYTVMLKFRYKSIISEPFVLPLLKFTITRPLYIL